MTIRDRQMADLEDKKQKLQKRMAALDAVDAERNYQDKRWEDSFSGGHHETGAYLSFIQHYITRAMQQITDEDTGALDSVRKIAALAIACMEDNGIVRRM